MCVWVDYVCKTKRVLLVAVAGEFVAIIPESDAEEDEWHFYVAKVTVAADQSGMVEIEWYNPLNGWPTNTWIPHLILYKGNTTKTPHTVTYRSVVTTFAYCALSKDSFSCCHILTGSDICQRLHSCGRDQ
jgi:hypothetical protein